MNLVVVGTGYVGLVTAVCMAEKGHNVICLDIDKNKIDYLASGKGSIIYEEGLEELMQKNKDRLEYSTDFANAYKNADVIFVCVGTPEKKDGSANLTYVFDAVKNIAEMAEKECVVVIKSTVPIGTNDKVEKILNEHNKNYVKFHVVSNPEFLAQGTAVHDTLHASRIVIGSEDKKATDIMLNVYKDFDAPKIITNRKSAEMIKYASNNFLALKISFINEIANLCEKIGANIEDVAKGMGFDERIGNKFLSAGIGYGGSCFPKDTKALHWLSTFNDYELKTIKAAIEVNENQKLRLIKKAKKYYKSFENLNVAVLGLTFKPGTDDLREAPSIVNVGIMLDDGANIKAYDPIGIPNFSKIYPEESNNIKYCKTIEDTLKDADICFIFTEWKEIKDLNPEIFKKYMKTPIVLDGRNCYNPETMEECGVEYNSIGR
ncbi:MAG TPA: UDP-glucose/GDP-mannose dehydrogenase family protein [Candidatus Mucispirillum faecigallinarum]|uniref:UDP-glucose 6-dehydrogenase n=1 Tax=Candidatus Mucispirillum faecigallinarum TaxID=2838699 RepID=A0A9D2GW43_9BACT|nr:UDP-glucose/GDP-mannose dehydrogenase family protein [Candidatus Mucispirillum faecigallinarum]